MSVHILTRLPGVPRGLVVLVGWDAPLHTFFAQVWNTPRESGAEFRYLVTEGTHPHEVADVHTVLDAVKPYASIPAGLREQLLAERREESDPTKGALRAALAALSTVPTQ
ncbi:hypothetical protein ACFQ7N_40230 [Streptomyces niveus]|uniref:hypothetical protein n=1 Tax=Streptomyces niveus TaxID=193462 RepID=UPI0036774081